MRGGPKRGTLARTTLRRKGASTLAHRALGGVEPCTERRVRGGGGSSRGEQGRSGLGGTEGEGGAGTGGGAGGGEGHREEERSAW